jgi:hypothetical protein
MALIGCVWGTVTAPLQASDEPPAPFAAKGWSVDRVRKDIHGSNLVTAHFTLKNISGADMSNLEISIDYRDMGESSAKTDIDHTARLKAGEEIEKAIAKYYVSEFTDYLITIAYQQGGKKYTAMLSGDSPIASPEPYSDTPIPGTSRVKLIGQSLTIERAWATGLEAVIRNFGELPANGVQIEVTFLKEYNKRPVVLGTELMDFNKGIVPGGQTVKGAVAFAKPYNNYDDYKVRIVLKDIPAEQLLSGQAFTNHADVEAAKWKFERSNKGKDVKISGQIRNGLKETISDVKMSVLLTVNTPVPGSHKKPPETKAEVKTVVLTIPGTFKTGDTADFSTDLKDLLRIDELNTTFEFSMGEAPAPATPPAPPGTTDTPPAAAENPAGTPASSSEVEVIPGNIVGADDGSVKIEAKVRNGTKDDVKGLKITFTFTLADGGSKKADVPLNGTLRAGKTANIKLALPGIGAFTKYSFSIAYGE